MRVGNSFFKMGSLLGLSIALAAGLVWWSLPLSAKRAAEVARGRALSQRIAQYQQQHAALPASDDWAALRQIGFTEEEMERANPQYTKLDEAAYELVFVAGFDGPYLMWNSRQGQWKEATPTFPSR
jgi:ABC-type transport system involved in cytochrome bd biosynthesis fused ATPase/permease subunit